MYLEDAISSPMMPSLIAWDHKEAQIEVAYRGGIVPQPGMRAIGILVPLTPAKGAFADVSRFSGHDRPTREPKQTE